MVKTSVMIIVLIILYDVLSNKNTNLNGSYAPINETQNSVSRTFSVNLDKLKNLKKGVKPDINALSTIMIVLSVLLGLISQIAGSRSKGRSEE